MSVADALLLVEAFEKKTGDSAFPKLGTTRRQFAAALRARITAPQQIDQGSSSLCGPAAFLFVLAGKDPRTYVRYVIDLYETGKASVGGLNVVPGPDTRNASTAGIEPVDWVGLSSLRDSSNFLLDYQSTSNELAGITAPSSLAGWFRRSERFSAVTNDTNLVIDKGLSTLLKAHQQHVAGGRACLLLGANVLDVRPQGGSLMPDHWVVLASEVKVDGKPVTPLLARGGTVDKDNELGNSSLSFDLFTWGSLRTLRVKIATFLDYFYGYVGMK